MGPLGACVPTFFKGIKCYPFLIFRINLPSEKNLLKIPPNRHRKRLEKGDAGEVSWKKKIGFKDSRGTALLDPLNPRILGPY
jgi:hypothetical protein